MRIIKIALAAAAIAVAQPASAFDPKDLLNGLKGLGGNDTTTTGGSSSGSGALGALGSLIGNAVANNKFSVDDLVGTWSYTSPAVSFHSDNALKKIGGAGAATAVENKLAPYYQKIGLHKTTLTVDAQHNFTMKLGVATLKGTIEKNDNGDLVFSFAAFGKISLGKVNAHATKAGSTLNLTFDATRLIQIITKVAGALNNSSLNALTTLINSYDGIYMGFKLKAATN